MDSGAFVSSHPAGTYTTRPFLTHRIGRVADALNETTAFISGEVADRLAARFGDDWDFDVRLHDLAGGDLVVEGELRANGRKISHSITVAESPGPSGAAVGRQDRKRLGAQPRTVPRRPRGRPSGPAYTPDRLRGVGVDPVDVAGDRWRLQRHRPRSSLSISWLA